MRNETLIVNRCFKKAIRRMSYDVSRTRRHQIDNDIMHTPLSITIPIAVKFTRKEKITDDFYSSLHLTILMEEQGIHARLASISDSNAMGGKTHTHFCVWYTCDGQEYIADPAFSIEEKAGFAFCHITLQEYVKTQLHGNKKLNIFPPIVWRNNNATLQTFLLAPEFSR